MEALALGPRQAGFAGLLLEREAELDLLREKMKEARGGQGSIVVLEGGYGLGKSSLLRVAEGGLTGPDTRVLAATGREHERDLDFGVVLQLFEETVALADPGQRARLLAGAAASAAPLLDPDAGLSTGYELGPVLRGLHRLAANLAGERPLVLLVDDADSCDPASLRFLLYLAERMASLPLTLVLAHGSAVPGPRPGALSRLVSHPLATRGQLEVLSASGTTELLRRRLQKDVRDSLCRVAPLAFSWSIDLPSRHG